MRRHAVFYLYCSQATYLLTSCVCLASAPENFISHDGLSYYGNSPSSFAPYAVGLISTSCFMIRSTHWLKLDSAPPFFSMCLAMAAACLIGVVITPSLSDQPVVRNLHSSFAIAIFVIQLVLTSRYAAKHHRRALDILLATFQVLSVVVAVLSFYAIGILPLMFPAQILATSLFAIILIRAVTFGPIDAPDSTQ